MSLGNHILEKVSFDIISYKITKNQLVLHREDKLCRDTLRIHSEPLRLDGCHGGKPSTSESREKSRNGSSKNPLDPGG